MDLWVVAVASLFNEDNSDFCDFLSRLRHFVMCLEVDD